MVLTGSEVGQGGKKSAQKNKYFEARVDQRLNPWRPPPLVSGTRLTHCCSLDWAQNQAWVTGRSWAGLCWQRGGWTGGWCRQTGPLDWAVQRGRRLRALRCRGWGACPEKASLASQTPASAAAVPSRAPGGGSSPRRHWTAPAPAAAAASQPLAPARRPGRAAWTAPVPGPLPELSEEAANTSHSLQMEGTVSACGVGQPLTFLTRYCAYSSSNLCKRAFFNTSAWGNATSFNFWKEKRKWNFIQIPVFPHFKIQGQSECCVYLECVFLLGNVGGLVIPTLRKFFYKKTWYKEQKLLSVMNELWIMKSFFIQC